MGCDFQIYGSQTDHMLQEACVQFTWDLSFSESCPKATSQPSIWSKDDESEFNSFFSQLPDEERMRWERESGRLNNVSTIEEALEHDNIVVRHSRLLFSDERIDQRIVSSYPGVSEMTPDAFFGHFTISYGISCAFDRTKDGLICSIEDGVSEYGGVQLFAHRDYHSGENREYKPRADRHRHVWLGGGDRIITGTSAPYVLCHAIKRHFIPNLVVAADYDVKFYEAVIQKIELDKRIAQAKGDHLIEVVREGVIEAKVMYDEITRHQREARAEEATDEFAGHPERFDKGGA